MNPPPADLAKDECFRCGYDLRGIADEQACPECGLLAQRSRRTTDELHDTRPHWLRSLSKGINLILLAILTPFIWPFVVVLPVQAINPGWWGGSLSLAWFNVAALLLFLGAILITRAEGYPPADRMDRRSRALLRLIAAIPLLVLLLLDFLYASALIYSPSLIVGLIWTEIVSFFIFAFTFPLLLFLRLRGLARRAHSAHLAEHCKIVGIGASSSVVYIAAAGSLLVYGSDLGLNPNWADKSTTALVLQLLIVVACCLFLLWSLYLLVRFAIAFGMASRKLRRNWLRDDRSLTDLPIP